MTSSKKESDAVSFTIGYRYGKNKNDEIFFVKLCAKDEQKGNFDWKSAECICLTITNANTGEEVEQATLRGVRNTYVEYRKNKEILGMCWFYHDLSSVISTYLGKDYRSGEFYEKYFLYSKLDYMMREVYKVQPENVAKELHISTDELMRRIRILTAGIKEERQWGLPILQAMQKLTICE